MIRRIAGITTKHRWNRRRQPRGETLSCPYGGSTCRHHESGSPRAVAASSPRSKDDKALAALGLSLPSAPLTVLEFRAVPREVITHLGDIAPRGSEVCEGPPRGHSARLRFSDVP